MERTQSAVHRAGGKMVARMILSLTRAWRAIEAWLFPSRVAALRVLLLAFLGFNALVRVALAVFNGEPSFFLPWRIVPALAIGALFDLGAATFFLAPFAAILAWWPARYPAALRIVLACALLPLCGFMVLVGAAELTFWNEFASRFNFIAVDYLIYTNEVIGNIRESYNIPLLLSLVAVVALALWWVIVRRIAALVSSPPGGLGARSIAALIWMLAPFVAFGALDARYKEFSADAQLSELAGNGYFDFWHAFRSNEIDYERFYRTLPVERAGRILAQRLDPARPSAEASRPPFERTIAGRGPEKKLNVVLISVEALSADFLAAFGNREGLTPRLDRLAGEGMLFTRMYATGTRTVRGLEALTLSFPPTPGYSIVKRPDNGGLFSLGEVFREKGYEPLYLYGGYAYFDNMGTFFSGNGYTVIDRTAIKSGEISFENIWGVADEDLFRLAIAELDKRYAARKPFFAHIMTVSNHRPFAYPSGRIDIPSGTGREGAVKYTDFAIGQFIDAARAKPWFDRTLFVIVADHTHKGRGRTELPPENYHIPLIVYAPGHVAPGRVDTIASQIDVGPTILGMLGFGYRSRFFGHDILHEGAKDPRALLANYQTVGYYRDGIVVELKPKGRYRIVDAATGRERAEDALSARVMDEAISYYQLASRAYSSGQLKVAGQR
jgi:phosphoglycerol transferase MdoB-like AlkP superfamily enzyme